MSSNFIKTVGFCSAMLLSLFAVGCSSEEGTLGDALSSQDNLLESVISSEDSLTVKSSAFYTQIDNEDDLDSVKYASSSDAYLSTNIIVSVSNI